MSSGYDRYSCCYHTEGCDGWVEVLGNACAKCLSAGKGHNRTNNNILRARYIDMFNCQRVSLDLSGIEALYHDFGEMRYLNFADGLAINNREEIAYPAHPEDIQGRDV